MFRTSQGSGWFNDDRLTGYDRKSDSIESKASTNNSVVIPDVILRGRAYNYYTDKSMLHTYRRDLKCIDVDCKTRLASALFDPGGLSPCLQSQPHRTPYIIYHHTHHPHHPPSSPRNLPLKQRLEDSSTFVVSALFCSPQALQKPCFRIEPVHC